MVALTICILENKVKKGREADVIGRPVLLLKKDAG